MFNLVEKILLLWLLWLHSNIGLLLLCGRVHFLLGILGLVLFEEGDELLGHWVSCLADGSKGVLNVR